MKIIICGKGGSGKSTIATMTARALSRQGMRVFLVDGDESNLGLHRLLGMEKPAVFLDHIGGKKGFRDKLNNAFPKGNTDAILAPHSKTGDIPSECVAEIDGIKLLSVGKIHQLNEGCACPIGRLSKTFLSNLMLEPEEILMVDAEAGIEHFGRGVDGACDLILFVVDPSYESFLLADKIGHMAREAGIDISFILNKMDMQVAAFMNAHIASEMVVARIPSDQKIFLNSLQGKKVDATFPEIETLCEFIRAKKSTLKAKVQDTPAIAPRLA